MAPFVIAGRLTPPNVSLLRAFRRLGVSALLLPPEDAVERAGVDDRVLGRVDVLQTLDGIEPGLTELRALQRAGALVLNPASALRAAHDKRETARRLEAAFLPHPRTVHIRAGDPVPAWYGPVVIKPRFGSWGFDVYRCDTPRELERTLQGIQRTTWFGRQGALVQELVPPQGSDMRLIVAGGMVVGAIRRVARSGEWRTNVALGAHREPVEPPTEARVIAVEAAAAIGADLVGVDLLPSPDGWTILELNGCVDFTTEYSLEGGDVFAESVGALLSRCACPAGLPDVSLVPELGTVT